MLTALYSSLTNPIPALLPAAWFRSGLGITGTLTPSNWADQSGNTRDLAQAVGGNQPIYLPYSGTAYAYSNATTGNYFTTPDSPANSITGTITIDIYLALDDWTPAAFNYLVTKDGGAPQSALFVGIAATGNPDVYFSHDGTNYTNLTASTNTGVADGSAKWIRFLIDPTVSNCKFYTGDDGSTWSQLGITVTGTARAGIFDSNAPLNICAGASNTLGNTVGKIYRVRVYNGDATGAGTLAVDFNPADFAETATNNATATSSGTGEVWTLKSAAPIPTQIVKSASLLGDGTTSKMATAGFALNQPFTDYFVARPLSWTAGDVMASGTAGIAGITQVTGTPNINLNAGSAAAENANMALGSKCIITAVFNGASSSLQVNGTAETTGNPGAGNPGGLSLFSDNAGANYWNGQIWERITFASAHDASTRARVQNWLNSVYHCY